LDERELPEWLLREDDELGEIVDDDEKRDYGRGSRARTEVDYTDSLNDREWLKCIGAEDEDVLEDDDANEEDRKSRRARKKGRRRLDDEDDDDEGPSRKRRKNGSAGQSAHTKRIMKKLMDVVVNYKDVEGRTLSKPFIKLPSRKELPDYYKIIKKPLDIKKILSKIEDDKYEDLDELEQDFLLLCKNTQQYNEEASLIHEDSIVLQSVFTSTRERLEKNSDGMKLEGEEDEAKVILMDDDGSGGSEEDTSQSLKMRIKLKKKPGSGDVSASSSTSGAEPMRTKRKQKAKRYVSDDEDDLNDEA